ncbi:hypothetical protein GVO57_04455 [Sphingomonas changnyeongensis]|uniref:Eps11J n=2 Tax=Sphingomonas changnyeongensis TaxID=2698679 RepID=A0A7Z2S5C6_9SPHN|nr:hypothetical protein GVO57_04455 [Sphingomonas changnyeongensis]
MQVVPYFGYDRVLADALRARGATVDVLADRPFGSAIMHGVAKLCRPAVLGHATRLYQQQVAAFGRSHYDHVLVINGQTMSSSYLRQLRVDFPSARFTFYIWDSFENKPYAVAALRHYDAALSFDRRAAATHGIGFRPLFYSPEFDLPAGSAADLDLSFIGTAHSDRPALIDAIDHNLPSSARRYWFLYLKAPWVLHYQRLTNRSFRGVPDSMFSYQPMPREKVRDIFMRSRTILDIEHDRQTGLTIRTFEALGARKKLVTTNPDVRNYDFYDPANIQILDRRRPGLDPAFLHAPARELAPALRYRYSVDGWIDDVLGGDHDA